MKYLVDYDAIVGTILKGKRGEPSGLLARRLLGAIDDTPYKLDVAKAKELLAKAGLHDGFSVTMDTRNNWPTKDIASDPGDDGPRQGIEIEIIPADNKQTRPSTGRASTTSISGNGVPTIRTRAPMPRPSHPITDKSDDARV